MGSASLGEASLGRGAYACNLQRELMEFCRGDEGPLEEGLSECSSPSALVPSVPSSADGHGRWAASRSSVSQSPEEVPACSPRLRDLVTPANARLVPSSSAPSLPGLRSVAAARAGSRSEGRLCSLAAVPRTPPAAGSSPAFDFPPRSSVPVVPLGRDFERAAASPEPRPSSSFSVPSPSGLYLSTPPPLAPIGIPPARASSPSWPGRCPWSALSPTSLRDALHRAASSDDADDDGELAHILSSSGHITPRGAAPGRRSSADSQASLPSLARPRTVRPAPAPTTPTPTTPTGPGPGPADTAQADAGPELHAAAGPPPPREPSPAMRRVVSTASFFAPPPPPAPGGMRMMASARWGVARATRHSRPRCPLFRSTSEWRLDELAASSEARPPLDPSLALGRKRRLAPGSLPEEGPSPLTALSPPPALALSPSQLSLPSSGAGSPAVGLGTRVFVESPHKWRRLVAEGPALPGPASSPPSAPPRPPRLQPRPRPLLLAHAPAPGAPAGFAGGAPPDVVLQDPPAAVPEAALPDADPAPRRSSFH
eukprot:tig00000692_g3195.t1